MTHTIKKYFILIWKRTGRNYIYVMWSWRFFWACKIGVSNAPKLRREQVCKSLSENRGYKVDLAIVPIPLLMWAYRTEKVLHNSKPFAILSYNGTAGTDGGTEWFWCCNPFFTTLFCIGCYAYDIGMYQWSVVFLLPCLPLDAILITTLFVLLQWALILGAVWLGWMGLNIVF